MDINVEIFMKWLCSRDMAAQWVYTYWGPCVCAKTRLQTAQSFFLCVLIGMAHCITTSEKANVWSIQRVLALHATRRPISGTNGLWTTRRWIQMLRFSANDCVPEIWRENKRKSQRAVDRAPSPSGYVTRTRHANFRWSIHYATLVVYTIYGLPSVLISVLNG